MRQGPWCSRPGHHRPRIGTPSLRRPLPHRAGTGPASGARHADAAAPRPTTRTAGATGRAPTAQIGLQRPAGRLREGRLLPRQHRGLRRARLRPAHRGLAAERDLSTRVMGQDLALPVLISATGVQAVEPDGEVAVARAAAARGTAIGLSSFASKPLTEVAAANPRVFFQTYWMGDRDDILRRLEHARAGGAKGLTVTLDWSFSHGRDWGSPKIPERLDLKAMLRFAPEALARPRWLLDFARGLRLPDLTAPNLADPRQPAPTFFGAYGQWMGTPPPSWADLAWLREQQNGPFMLKGVGRVDDALRAVDTGATAISVSNHGGNNLDTTPAPKSGCSPRSPTPWAIRSRCCSTAASGAAATSSRRSPWERRPS
ncbi:alpha-hydroxy-acid oxidizing protein [Streptomyces sp. SKN60]|uniref:alpha-hydroxy-acid oxidizing protein n=1 Tax=Streptomyces sp. SKN60 TaxID=2855506 RepID=UPI0022474492|nr:alpha-hydroxy-acid oxidizing protein [Streptomyces sp. SKN60]